MTDALFFHKAIQNITLNESNMLKYTTHLTKIIPKARSLPALDREILPLDRVSYPAVSQYPTEDDLFWCFYIIHLGLRKYETIHHFFTEEKKVKIEFVHLIRNHKDILKQNKWKRNQIENELVHEKKISLTTFICLCIITNHSVVLLDRRKVLDKRMHGHTTDVHLMIKEDEEWTLYDEDNKQNKIQKALETMWIIDNVKKPLRSISAYKVKELKDICRKLNLSSEKKKKKELYQIIMENL